MLHRSFTIKSFKQRRVMALYAIGISRLSSQSANGDPQKDFIGRYEKKCLERRDNPNLEPNTTFKGPIDQKIANPLIGTFNYKAAQSQVNIQSSFEESLTGEDLEAWTKAKYAAATLGISSSDIPGITEKSLSESLRKFLEINDRLSSTAYSAAADAYEELNSYIKTELYHRHTKAHFARIVTEERMKLGDDFVNIWSDNAGFVMKLFAIFFFSGALMIVISTLTATQAQSKTMDKAYRRCADIFFAVWSLNNPQAEKKKFVDCSASTAEIYVDETILNSSMTTKGDSKNRHVFLASADPLYEELVADAAEVAHKERQHILKILGRTNELQ